MRKVDLLLLYLLALIIFSSTLIFQTDPGYMDSEFYYLGSRQILRGEISIPVLWNYLDHPSGLPTPIFSYWMPFSSLLSALSMCIFGASFLGSRILLVLLSAGLAPFTYWLSYKICFNRFSSFLAGTLAIFSGYYLKFLTIPETVLIYMFLGALYFYFFGNLLSNDNKEENKAREIIGLGLISGFLHLTRVDGIIFLILGIILLIYDRSKKHNYDKLIFFRDISIFIGSYLLVMSFWFVTNFHFYQTIFSPASSKAMWIATYDDTFIYPASELNLNYWLEYSISLRPQQISEALKMNLGTLLGVQMMVFGLPLFILGLKKNNQNLILRIGIIYYSLIFIFMTVIFPLAGSRGGFLHSAAAIQILIWILMADGLLMFINWGIRKRNWQLQRSKKMFGSAFLAIVVVFTLIVYNNDVIGDSFQEIKWSQDYQRYQMVEEEIARTSNDKKEVVMINNPLGYYYSTDRWGIVIPNSEVDQFLEVINKFEVRYIVLDKNLPDKFNQEHILLINEYFDKIQELPAGIRIYAHKN